jgi:Mor family transcriptional regulator
MHTSTRKLIYERFLEGSSVRSLASAFDSTTSEVEQVVRGKAKRVTAAAAKAKEEEDYVPIVRSSFALPVQNR